MTRENTLFFRLLRSEKGVALIEFAFAAPILLMLILGGLELANYALAHMRVNQIAMTVADNAGRVTTGIDEANVYEIFAGAGVIGEPIDFEDHGRITLSSLQHNGGSGSSEGQMINWQRCWGDAEVNPVYGFEDDGRNDNSLEDGFGNGSNNITSAEGTAVMVVEVSYAYQPLIDTQYMVINESIRHQAAFNVRGRQSNDITNSQSLAVLSCEDFGNGSGSGGSSSGGGTSGGGNGGSSSSGTTTSGGSGSTSSGSTSSGSGGGSTSSSSTSGGSSGNGSSGNGSSGSNNGSSGSNNGSSGSNNGSSGNGSSGNGNGNGGGG